MFINKFNFPILCLSVWNAISSPNFRSAAIEGDLSWEYQYSKNPLPMSEMRTFPLLHCYLHIEDKIHRHTGTHRNAPTPMAFPKPFIGSWGSYGRFL